MKPKNKQHFNYPALKAQIEHLQSLNRYVIGILHEDSRGKDPLTGLLAVGLGFEMEQAYHDKALHDFRHATARGIAAKENIADFSHRDKYKGTEFDSLMRGFSHQSTGIHDLIHPKYRNFGGALRHLTEGYGMLHTLELVVEKKMREQQRVATSTHPVRPYTGTAAFTYQ